MTRIRILEKAEELQKVRGLWESLSRGPRATIFQIFESNLLAARFFSKREIPYVVVAESDSGAAIIPAVIRRRDRRLSLLGESLFDYRDVLHEGDEAVQRAAWNELAALGLPLEVTALRGTATASHWGELELSPFAAAPLVESSKQSAQEFLAAHRRLLSRSKRIYRKGISQKRYRGDHSDIVRRIYELKGRSRVEHGKNLFSDALRRDFMVDICRTQARHCDIFTYEADGEIVAAIVSFRGWGIRHFYTVYYDPRWADLSPGQMLLFETTAETLQHGVDCDFMTGDYPYKTRLATSRVMLFVVNASPNALARFAACEPLTTDIAA